MDRPVIGGVGLLVLLGTLAVYQTATAPRRAAVPPAGQTFGASDTGDMRWATTVGGDEVSALKLPLQTPGEGAPNQVKIAVRMSTAWQYEEGILAEPVGGYGLRMRYDRASGGTLYADYLQDGESIRTVSITDVPSDWGQQWVVALGEVTIAGAAITVRIRIYDQCGGISETGEYSTTEVPDPPALGASAYRFPEHPGNTYRVSVHPASLCLDLQLVKDRCPTATFFEAGSGPTLWLDGTGPYAGQLCLGSDSGAGGGSGIP